MKMYCIHLIRFPIHPSCFHHSSNDNICWRLAVTSKIWEMVGISDSFLVQKVVIAVVYLGIDYIYKWLLGTSCQFAEFILAKLSFLLQEENILEGDREKLERHHEVLQSISLYRGEFKGQACLFLQHKGYLDAWDERKVTIKGVSTSLDLLYTSSFIGITCITCYFTCGFSAAIWRFRGNPGGEDQSKSVSFRRK